MQANRLIVAGKVAKPHGLKGEICIEPYVDSPSVLDGISRVYLQLPGRKPRPFALTGWRPHLQYVLVFLDKIRGRDMVDPWRGAEFLLREKDLPPLDEDEVYVMDMIGLSVQLKDGTVVGILEEIQFLPSHELWHIASPDGREILFPAVPEFVLDIDLDNEVAVIEPPEGLLELYEN